jgi:Pyruvate/2-oxoacid:ferredoxin oxidoreductase gamma subunit
MHSEAVTKSLTATLPKKILEINLKAFNLGLEEAQKEYPTASKSWSYS